MPGVGFEPMIQVFEQAKTVHALDRAATVIGTQNSYEQSICLKTRVCKSATNRLS
jgi:hypothetical protein